MRKLIFVEDLVIYPNDCQPGGTVPPGDIRHCLETSLLVTLKERGLCATIMEWVEGREAAKHPSVHRTAPQPRMIQPQMSLVPNLRA